MSANFLTGVETKTFGTSEITSSLEVIFQFSQVVII